MSDFVNYVRAAAVAFAASAAVAACSAGANYAPTARAAVPGQTMGVADPSDASVSVLETLKKHVEIGSTVDPKFGQLNPYGLTVAPSTAGKMTRGDLVVCNFNAKGNVQGTGFTVVAPQPATDVIATGFAVNHGMPGSIFGPSASPTIPRAIRSTSSTERTIR
ncbi:MAG TPA: hypothetical protein VMF61_09115 [Candidatus Acidoferrales bacterium]|nr:hypothetical protein [Candidatus Acidoferrales bacterium]